MSGVISSKLLLLHGLLERRSASAATAVGTPVQQAYLSWQVERKLVQAQVQNAMYTYTICHYSEYLRAFRPISYGTLDRSPCRWTAKGGNKANHLQISKKPAHMASGAAYVCVLAA